MAHPSLLERTGGMFRRSRPCIKPSKGRLLLMPVLPLGMLLLFKIWPACLPTALCLTGICLCGMLKGLPAWPDCSTTPYHSTLICLNGRRTWSRTPLPCLQEPVHFRVIYQSESTITSLLSSSCLYAAAHAIWFVSTGGICPPLR